MKHRHRPLIRPTLKELIKFRCYIGPIEQKKADEFILEWRDWHPDIRFVLENIGTPFVPRKSMSLRDRNRLVDITHWLQLKMEVDTPVDPMGWLENEPYADNVVPLKR